MSIHQYKTRLIGYGKKSSGNCRKELTLFMLTNGIYNNQNMSKEMRRIRHCSTFRNKHTNQFRPKTEQYKQ